jgi:hypothetical protein
MLNVFTFSEMLAIMSVAWFVVEYRTAQIKWTALMEMAKLSAEDAEQEARLRYAQATLAELPLPIDIPEHADIRVCPGCDEHFVTGMPGTKKVGAFDFCSDACWEQPMPFPALPMDRRYPC